MGILYLEQFDTFESIDNLLVWEHQLNDLDGEPLNQF